MSSNSREEESAPSIDLKFTMEAMMKQFECFGNLFQHNNECLECFEARMMKLERRQYHRRHDRRKNIEDEYKGMLGDDFKYDEHATFVNYGGNESKNARRKEDRVDHNVGSIKMKIPYFQSKNDLDT